MIPAFRTIRLGVKSLLVHKLRSCLTMLGILIGVAAVSIMLAIAEGGQQEALERIQALGSTNILLRSKKPEVTEQTSSGSMFTAQAYGLKYDDADRIRETMPGIELVVPIREGTKEVRVGPRYLQANVLGTNPEYIEVVRLRISEGRWISEEDNRRRANVAVLGSSAAGDLFPLENPLGQTIRVGSERLVVVGLLSRLGRVSGNSGPSVDESIFIPYQVSRDWYGDVNIERTGGSMKVESVELSEIKIKAKSADDVLAAAGTLRDMMAKSHDKKDYELTVPLELLREIEASKRIWKIVLAFIGGLSLLVGGIGIMNVMLATVTERTREIGIRRALGAKRRNIVSQFLVETVVLSGIGGLIGVIFAFGAPAAISYFAPDVRTIVRWEHPILALLISAFVGVVAGLYPAIRAANMDPVEALRHE